MPHPSDDQRDAAVYAADDALGILGNETRLEILHALWRERQPDQPPYEAALSFSELFDRIEYDDPGNLSYHLNQLVGPYIRQTENGYSLYPKGLQIIKTIIAGTLTADSSLGDAPVDIPCRHCGADQTLTYDSGMLFGCCTADCAGTLSFDEFPDRTVIAFELPSAALANRSPAEILHAATVHRYTGLESRLLGICPICTGQVATQAFDVCPDHDPDTGQEGVCATCNRADKTRLFRACERCKDGGWPPGWMAIMTHPPVMAFYYDHGIDVHTAPRDRLAETIDRERVVSENPIEVEVTVAIDDARRVVRLDADGAVIDMGVPESG